MTTLHDIAKEALKLAKKATPVLNRFDKIRAASFITRQDYRLRGVAYQLTRIGDLASAALATPEGKRSKAGVKKAAKKATKKPARKARSKTGCAKPAPKKRARKAAPATEA